MIEFSKLSDLEKKYVSENFNSKHVRYCHEKDFTDIEKTLKEKGWLIYLDRRDDHREHLYKNSGLYINDDHRFLFTDLGALRKAIRL